ncbi:MAG: 50S ribosomal protein L10 [Dongiaceae bacterium]
MDRSQKAAVVKDVAAKANQVQIMLLIQQTGLNAGATATLRKTTRDAGVDVQVVKNTLARMALKGTQYEYLTELCEGPTAFATANDPVAIAKVLVDFANTNDKLKIIGGGMGERKLDVASIQALAKLPSLNELRAKILGLLQAPATKIAGVLQAPAGQLARVISAYGNKAS